MYNNLLIHANGCSGLGMYDYHRVNNGMELGGYENIPFAKIETGTHTA